MKRLSGDTRRAWWLAVPLLLILYFSCLTTAGMLGPDEPRYASIGREMARSGDWVTPRLWGQPWFEKPALLYWMTATAFRLGLAEDLAPRLPVALISVAFLIFFQWILSREFGGQAAWMATLILGTSAAWLGYSFIGATDLPMAAAFSAAILLALRWIETGERRRLPVAAALLGVAVLAKGLVPLVLATPLLWFGRRRLLDLLRPAVVGSFLVVGLPWYVVCYLRNGGVFLHDFFWEQHFGRFLTTSLQHGQPFWFYVPVLLASLLPWTPLLILLVTTALSRSRLRVNASGVRSDASDARSKASEPRASASGPLLYSDTRPRFLLVLLVFGIVFFSLSKNKLPGYLLPLLPAAATLMGTALAETKQIRWLLASIAICLAVIPAAMPILPRALTGGISRASLPVFQWTWLLPVVLAACVFWLEGQGNRHFALAMLAISITAGVLLLKIIDLPLIDRAVSARPIWREIAGEQSRVCVAQMHRSWRYGLNYYSVVPLPDCTVLPMPLEIRQQPGNPPVLVSRP